jgi:hypothetical protein
MNLKEVITHPEVNKYITKIEFHLIEIRAAHIRKEYKNKENVGIGFSVFNVQKMMHIPYSLTAQVDKCCQNICEEQYRVSPERLDPSYATFCPFILEAFSRFGRNETKAKSHRNYLFTGIILTLLLSSRRSTHYLHPKNPINKFSLEVNQSPALASARAGVFLCLFLITSIIISFCILIIHE